MHFELFDQQTGYSMFRLGIDNIPNGRAFTIKGKPRMVFLKLGDMVITAEGHNLHKSHFHEELVLLPEGTKLLFTT